jgi:hypothetical protein
MKRCPYDALAGARLQRSETTKQAAMKRAKKKIVYPSSRRTV